MPVVVPVLADAHKGLHHSLFISIRCAHPALVQFELALGDTEAAIPEPAQP